MTLSLDIANIRTLAARTGPFSTCHKRATVCVLLDEDNEVVSVAANTCDPAEGVCQRLGVHQTQQEYDVESTCNWEHAEARALDQLPEEVQPTTAVVLGHDFVCPTCDEKLKARGVESIAVIPEGPGVGLRV